MAVTRRLCIILRCCHRLDTLPVGACQNFAWWLPLSLPVPAPALQALVRQMFVLGFGRRLAQLLINCGGDLPRWLFRGSSSRVICMSSYSCLIQSLAVNLLNALVKYQTPHSHWWCIIIFPRGLLPGAGGPSAIISSIRLEHVAIDAWSSVLCSFELL